jgi:glycerol kinase
MSLFRQPSHLFAFLALTRLAVKALSSARSVPSYVGALDQGTSSTRFVIFNQNGDIVGLHQKEHAQHYPKPGWVEHDADEIYHNALHCIEEAMKAADLQSSDISSIGITNQRETTVVWDKNTGVPLHRAVVWNCVRTSDIVSEIKTRCGGVDGLREKTG